MVYRQALITTDNKHPLGLVNEQEIKERDTNEQPSVTFTAASIFTLRIFKNVLKTYLFKMFVRECK